MTAEQSTIRICSNWPLIGTLEQEPTGSEQAGTEKGAVVGYRRCSLVGDYGIDPADNPVLAEPTRIRVGGF